MDQFWSPLWLSRRILNCASIKEVMAADLGKELFAMAMDMKTAG